MDRARSDMSLQLESLVVGIHLCAVRTCQITDAEWDYELSEDKVCNDWNFSPFVTNNSHKRLNRGYLA